MKYISFVFQSVSLSCSTGLSVKYGNTSTDFDDYVPHGKIKSTLNTKWKSISRRTSIERHTTT